MVPEGKQEAIQLGDVTDDGEMVNYNALKQPQVKYRGQKASVVQSYLGDIMGNAHLEPVRCLQSQLRTA